MILHYNLGTCTYIQYTHTVFACSFHASTSLCLAGVSVMSQHLCSKHVLLQLPHLVSLCSFHQGSAGVYYRAVNRLAGYVELIEYTCQPRVCTCHGSILTFLHCPNIVSSEKFISHYSWLIYSACVAFYRITDFLWHVCHLTCHLWRGLVELAHANRAWPFSTFFVVHHSWQNKKHNERSTKPLFLCTNANS